MRRILGWLLTASVLAVAPMGTARAAEERVALVIGNGAYAQGGALPNPVNDARAMAQALKRIGFHTTEGYDLTRAEMIRRVRDFGRAAEGAGVALVYYAGHGLQVSGRNYLLPIDARLEREMDLNYDALALDRMLEEASAARHLRIVILDACRDNPFTARIARSLGATRSARVGSGLAQVQDVAPDTLVAYATAANAVAIDGSGAHSPYTASLLQNLETPGLEINLLFGRVRDGVMAATDGRQQPFTYGSLGGTPFYLIPPEAKEAPAPTAAPSQVPPPDKDASYQDREFDLSFWRAIENSRSPADFEAYLEQFPNGTFAALARNRLKPRPTVEPRPAEPKDVASLPAPPRRTPPIRPVELRPTETRPALQKAMEGRALGSPSGTGRDPRCLTILERTQLGEPLSDADRTLLHTSCKS